MEFDVTVTNDDGTQAEQKVRLNGDQLTQEERNLLSVGYKNMMSTRRQSWRTVQQQITIEGGKDNQNQLVPHYETYKNRIGQEIYAVIDKVIQEVVEVYTAGDR